MIREVTTQSAPAAIGPYSQAIVCKGFLFVSGQLPVDPDTGKLLEASITVQTERVLKNIEAVLRAEGLSFSHVVKVDIFLKNLEDFGEVNALYGAAFSTNPKPARQTIQAAKLPLDAKIEISCIAALPS